MNISPSSSSESAGRNIARALASPFFIARGWMARRLARSPVMQEAFLEQLAERNCQLVVDLGDHSVRCFPGDSIGRGVFFNGEWQRDLLSAAIALLSEENKHSPDAIFVDVGANIGTQSVYAHLCGKFAKVVSVEPEPSNFRVLKSNLAENGIPDHLAFNLGAGNAPSSLRLYRNEKSSGKHSFCRPSQDYVDVMVDTVEAILQKAQLSPDDVGLVWIDVEGFELQVLQGMPSLLARRCPIVVEFTPAFYGPENTRQFVSLVSAHYRAFKSFQNGKLIETPISSLMDVNGQLDILLGFDA